MEKLATRSVKMKDGDVIIKEGDTAYYAYVLKEGKAKVIKNIYGKDILVSTLKPGDIFAEMAFLSGRQRSASVVADGDVTLEMIGKEDFLRAFSKLPDDGRKKLESMVARVSEITDVYSRLVVLLDNLQKMNKQMIDVAAFNKEIEAMPDIVCNVATRVACRLNEASGELGKLVTHIELATKTID